MHDFCLIYRYKIVLNSDSKSFDGYDRLDMNQTFTTEDYKFDGRPDSFRVYIPSRTAFVLALVDDVK